MYFVADIDEVKYQELLTGNSRFFACEVTLTYNTALFHDTKDCPERIMPNFKPHPIIVCSLSLNEMFKTKYHNFLCCL